MYAVVSIGNTDNKLTQQEWHAFVTEANGIFMDFDHSHVHFMGGPNNWSPWQSVAWIVEFDGNYDTLRFLLHKLGKKYNQESIFLLTGEGRFV